MNIQKKIETVEQVPSVFSRARNTLNEGLAVIAIAGLVSCKSEPMRQDLGQSQMLESQVIISPATNDGKVINTSALAFESPIVSTEIINQIIKQCSGEQKCVQQKASDIARSSIITTIQNAHFVVQYFEHGTDTYKSEWISVPGCENIVAGTAGTAYKNDPKGSQTPYTYYYGQCDLSVINSDQLDIRAVFIPQPNDKISSSSAEYELRSLNGD